MDGVEERELTASIGRFILWRGDFDG